MSNLLRNLLITVMVMLMATFAFFSGYLANDYVEARNSARDVTDQEQFTVFWEAWERVESDFLGELPSGQQLTYAAIRGSLQELDDPYTVFLEPQVREEERDSLRGNFGGIGVELTRAESGTLYLEPTPENPAALAGVQSADVLLKIDGVDVRDDEPVRQIEERLRGEKGSEVVLTVLRDDVDMLDIRIRRADILIPSVIFRPLRSNPTIGYIQLVRFTGESGGEVRNAIESLQAQGIDQFVLDLRNNGGGLLSAAVDVSDLFLDDELVYYQQSRTEPERGVSATRQTLLPSASLVVLINGGTASASEIVAGALQDHNRATLVGERTFGKGSVQHVHDLSDGSSVHVTSSRWLTPGRQPIDQVGLVPEIEIAPTQVGIDNGRDEQLDRAVQHLQGLKVVEHEN